MPAKAPTPQAGKVRALDPSRLPHIISALRQEYLDRGVDAYQVGSGHCENFAHEVLARAFGEDWIFFEGEERGFETLDTERFINPETNDWDWLIIRELTGLEAPTDIPAQRLTKLAAINPSHIWIYSNGRHYDVEHPEGVSHFLELMFFQRWISFIDRR